ncbi:MAG TPA: DUF1343 domain-containing protein [Candidatus Didemnitutus sp.]|nr:DUF1343 domain-containing protein [Candidatus Didemnitutus sp.]
MSRRLLVSFFSALFVAAALLLAPGCASKPAAPAPKPTPPAPVTPPPAPKPPEPEPEILPPVMLGIDVLEADGFKAIAGKKLGLLTHAAGVNRRGESTINVLRRVPGAKLICLFAPENGLEGTTKSATHFDDTIHGPTGLPLYSLYGKNKRPTPAQLKNIDALVVDLQDIGSRSYTFISWMRYAMEACFEANVEIIILDRPNPLGGLKVDGPPLDQEWMSDVGAFRVPYVHGLTMGELARMAKDAPGVLALTERVRAAGKLTVIPMRGWTRKMRWPDTGLKWVPTSPMIPDFNAAVGYAMVGLGCEQSQWRSGIGTFYPFRGISYPKKTPEQIIAELGQYKIPGINLVKAQGIARDTNVINGVYVDVDDWEAWHPTELSFYMMKSAAKWDPTTYAKLVTGKPETRTFLIHVGSGAWLTALRRDGARVDVASFLKNWRERAAIYQERSKKYWLYQ